MSKADELKSKNENLFQRNTVLINQLEEKEKRIAELETQIGEMKCCCNCKHYNMAYIPYWCNKNKSPTFPRFKCDKWEIREND